MKTVTTKKGKHFDLPKKFLFRIFHSKSERIFKIKIIFPEKNYHEKNIVNKKNNNQNKGKCHKEPGQEMHN